MRKLFVLVLCLSFASVAYSQDGSCSNGQCLQKVVEKSVSCEKGRCWLNGELTVTKQKQTVKATSTKKQYTTTKRFRLFRKR